jgi:hypothetical protein
VTVSGFTGSTYPDDLPSQKSLFGALLKPLVEKVLGPGTEFELFPRRGAIRNGTLPPCEVLGCNELVYCIVYFLRQYYT